MPRILPSINCHPGDLKTVVERCRQIESIFEAAETPNQDRWAHFDVADGAFTFHKSWNEPEKLKEVNPKFKFEVHLMVEDSLALAETWLECGASGVVVHAETTSLDDFSKIRESANAKEALVFLALNPETSAESVRPYFDVADGFLVLAVHPGLSGQKFLPSVLEKVKFLRQELPSVRIEVDGGIDLETARLALSAGADSLVSASDIFGSPDPEGEYEKLWNL